MRPRDIPHTLAKQLGAVYALLILCILIRPVGLGANEGFSYYGNYKLTIIPYAAAFVLYAYGLWKTSEAIGAKTYSAKAIMFSLRAMAIFLVGLVVTPSDLIDGWHTVFGASLFALQLVISIFIAGWLMRRRLTIGLTLVEFLAGLLSFYYLPKTHGALLESQALFQIAFGVLLLAYLHYFLSHHSLNNPRHDKNFHVTPL